MAAQIAVDLVNLGQSATREAIGDLLQTHGYRPLSRVTDSDTAELVRWAGHLRSVFRETDLPRRVRMLNELLAVTVAQPYISQHDGRPPHLHFADETAPMVDRIKAYTAGGLAHALCEDPARIGHCGRASCDVVFVDTSRNGRRRFCSTQCATRVHVADHRARRSVARPA